MNLVSLPTQTTQHIIDEVHPFGPLNDIRGIIHIAKKGRMLDTLEKFYIYGRQNMEINPIFEALVQHTSDRGPQLHT
jgi:hypothetical protein